jgi:hypothetical protein
MALPVALVVNRDRHAGVEERELAEPLRQRLEAELDDLEHRRVGLERDLGAALVGRAGDLEIADRRAALVALLMHLSVAPDLELEPFRQRVHDRDSDAVETARDLVRRVFELSAGVEHGHHDFGRRAAALVHVHRNAAAVVNDRHRAVDVHRDVDVAAEAGQRLVNRVVDDFVDQVMQARRAGRADVHRRPFSDGLEAFENFDFIGAIVVGARRAAATSLTEISIGQALKSSSA